MDSTDVRILCEMAFLEQDYVEFRERHPSAARMGKKLRLDEKTVRARVRSMERSGFIKYYQASPSLALFGMRYSGLFRFEALNLSTKFAVITALHHVPRLVESSDYLGPFVTGSIAGATEKEARDGAERLAGQFELSTTVLGNREIGDLSSRLDRLDWQIVKALRYDAKTGDGELAHELSVTPRMVAYRVGKLLDSGAIRIRAVIDPQRQAGLVFYELELHLDAPGKNSVSRWLRETYGHRLWNLSSPGPDILLASLFCFALSEPEESVMMAQERPGVKRCLLFILKEVIEPQRPNWLDSLMDLRIES